MNKSGRGVGGGTLKRYGPVAPPAMLNGCLPDSSSSFSIVRVFGEIIGKMTD